MFTHSKNSHFQYTFFLAGRCHTADEAYRVIKDQLEEREQTIKGADASMKRAQAKRLRAEESLRLNSHSQYTRLEAEADLLEIQAGAAVQTACYDEAVRERDFLKTLLERLQPYRKYAALPDHEAMQACQREEWLHELIFRAENYIASQGAIPADHIAAMRQHPDFENVLSPILGQLQAARAHGRMAACLHRPTFMKALIERSTDAPLSPVLTVTGPDSTITAPELQWGTEGNQ